jgi:hypothetical protein
MGIFDTYFQPQTYGGNGGLIDRLLSQLGTQGQYQPSQGFPGNPMDAQASTVPQNNPIAVGNYQMPRVGNPDQFQPQQAMTPPNAQPTQGQVPQQSQPDIPQLQASQPGFGAFYQNLKHGGGLIGSIAAGVTGQRNDPQGQQEALLQAQYRALIPILGEQKARLAVVSPEAGKLLLAQALGNDQYSVVQTGENDLGRKTFEVFNKKTGEHTPIAGAAADAGGGLGNMELSGKEYLATLPKAQQNQVIGMVEGTIPPPSSFAMSKPYWANLLAAAKNYDPTFDATKWAGRVAGVKDFSAGKSSEMVRSANQTLHHVGQLLDSMDELNNGQYPIKNAVGNAINERVFGTGEQGAFRTNAHAVAEELSKVFKGANLSDAEIKTWESNLSENMSPEQQRAQVAKLRDLLQGSLQALEEKRINSIGPVAAEKQGPIIREEGQKVLDRINNWVNANKATGEQKTKSGVKWSVE